MFPGKKLKQCIAALTRIDKVFLGALVLRIVYPSGLPAAGLARLFFIVALIIFLIGSFPKHLRTFLWRVRHRLVATWIFVGLVPILLIAVLLLEIGFVLMGQIVGYMTSNEIARESESVRDAANTLAWSVAHAGSAPAARVLTQAFV